MADEEAHAGEVLRAVGELRGTAVPEVVRAHAIDLPRCELAGFVRAPACFEKLRTKIVYAEDESDVGARTFERLDGALC